MGDRVYITEDAVIKKISENRVIAPKSQESNESDIAKKIGRGTDAQNSFVYLTLVGTFWAGGVISLFVVLNHFCFRHQEKIPDFVGDLKAVWSIFIPLMTLALGYAFGKSKD